MIRIVILALAMSGATAAVLFLFASRESPTDLARTLVARCAQETDKSACYEREVPKLYPEISLDSVFAVVREIRAQDPAYQFCHVLAHKLGERIVAEDPARWVEAIPLNPPDGLCSNGFVHGVVGGRFRAEVLSDASLEKFIPDFRRACEAHDGWNPSSLDRAICYHGMGHLFDFITDAHIPKALRLCERTASEEYHRVCVQGVFMQIYQPLEPDDFQLIARMGNAPTKQTLRAYCGAFSDPLVQGSCLEESWPLFVDEILEGDVEPFCSWQPNAEEKDQCYIAVSSIIGRMTLGDHARVQRACDAFSPVRRSTCYAYSAQAVLEESRDDGPKALAICALATGDSEQRCRDVLIDHAQFIFGSDQEARDRFCTAFDGNERGRCVAPLQ